MELYKESSDFEEVREEILFIHNKDLHKDDMFPQFNAKLSENTTDFDDFGLGCFLLAGSEIYRLGR